MKKVSFRLRIAVGMVAAAVIVLAACKVPGSTPPPDNGTTSVGDDTVSAIALAVAATGNAAESTAGSQPQASIAKTLRSSSARTATAARTASRAVATTSVDLTDPSGAINISGTMTIDETTFASSFEGTVAFLKSYTSGGVTFPSGSAYAFTFSGKSDGSVTLAMSGSIDLVIPGFTYRSSLSETATVSAPSGGVTTESISGSISVKNGNLAPVTKSLDAVLQWHVNAPTTGTVTDSSVALSWPAAAHATSYQVFRSANSSGPFTAKVYSGSATSFTDTGLSKLTTYYYEVQITTSSGSGQLSPSGSGFTGTISTFSGNGTAGYLGDGGPAASAELNLPSELAFDSSGNLYVTDEENHVVRKVSASGTITTVAGSGTYGYTGDGGAATSAELSYPLGIALDSAGNLYIGDSGNHVIRKVNTSGTITTVAGNGTQGDTGDGGAATAAELDTPAALAFDSNGDLYIADGNQGVIREVNASGVISTVAGSPAATSLGDGGPATSAELNQPGGMAFDAAGNLYIADFGNNLIRKVDGSGTITSVAGSGAAGSSGDGGPATAAQLAGPSGVAFDAGNLYVADHDNNRIRMVNASGTIATVSGSGNQGYTGDSGPATAAELNLPDSIAIDSAGNLYIADTGNSVIREVH